MKKFTLLFLVLHVSLFAYSHSDIIKDYKAGKYRDVCLKSSATILGREKDEKILSIVGDACAKSNYINPLCHVIRGLISTPEFRKNGSYFATLVLQKKLIYQFMNDGIDLSNLRLPRSDHVLSVVFENLVKRSYAKEGRYLIIKTDSRKYKVWITDARQRVVHIEEYVDGKEIKTHRFL